ncbi:MAG: GDSL-type esterase/lipase family protein [Thermoleophilaceae bacterium]
MALGVLAFGDSITNGGGELQWGVALQSWALWVARALGMPYSGFAFDGARAADVVAHEIPAFGARSAEPGGRYDVGCLYIGVNDVRALDWDAAAFERDFREALGFLRERCERVVTMTIPLDLGRPRAGAKVEQGNRIIERVAGEAGALVGDLRGFRGRRLLMADQVHPSAFGQLAIACKALEALAADGLPARADPWSMVSWDESRFDRLRGDAAYAYRRTKEELKAALIVAAVNAGWRPG